jgi:NAD(P) transhydrogenase subunit beta
MTYASKVMIVPGYGLAVAQAQHACHELEKLLESKGVDVYYAIHPVAGRMPGHMNVLLAETDVPYEKLMEMEQANEEFSTADVVLILGANDVVNPAAKEDTSSPIYGMPI